MPLSDVLANDSVAVGDVKVKEFAIKLCTSMVGANAEGKNIVKTMEGQMLAYIGITRNPLNYKDKIITFYNANHHDFICKGKVTDKTRETEHLMKRAIALSIHNKVLYDFLLNHPNTDVNAVEYLNGKPETVVDYLDTILADPNVNRKYVISDMKALREMLVDYFNGKKAIDL